MRAKEYPVINSRLLFRCPHCDARRSFGVQPHVRRRTIRCHKCGNTIHCNLNRRKGPRESQTGKCTMMTQHGQQIEISLHDISSKGLGFHVPIAAAKAIPPLQQIQFKCAWNPRLLGSHRYIVRNRKGNRIGAEKIT